MNAHSAFDPDQTDVDAIVAALLAATRGSFRKIMKVLDHVNTLIALPIEDHPLHQARQRKGDPPAVLPFNAGVIREATAMTAAMP